MSQVILRLFQACYQTIKLTSIAGTLLRIDKYEDDENVYTVTQVPYESQTPKIVQGLEEDRVEIDWSFGVGKVRCKGTTKCIKTYAEL
jgi:hypothetical protein